VPPKATLEAECAEAGGAARIQGLKQDERGMMAR
jgi:hypothetical protein